MTILTYLVMFGWIPGILYVFKNVNIFGRFSCERALVWSFVIAWLFLPEAKFPLQGLPDYTKMSATCYGILLATTIYDFGRFRSFKLGWIDLPMIIWCLCPFASSISNGLGSYDGFSEMLIQTVTWGVPYFLGRIYLNSLVGLRQLAIAMFIGGILYVPFCLYEIRFSPQIHRIFYGFYAHDSFAQTMRYGGFRPSVFMSHGLELGLWMMAAALIGVWLWKTGAIYQIQGIPMSWLVPVLLVTFVLVKSTGAYLYFLMGAMFLWIALRFRTSMPVLLMIIGIGCYLYLGVSGTFYGNSRTSALESVEYTLPSVEKSSPAGRIVSFTSDLFNEERAQSLEFRFTNEQALSEKARQKPIFGWAGWGRNRVANQWGEDVSVTDSLWILAFGHNGIVGLISIVGSILLPVLGFSFLCYPAKYWAHPKVAPAAVLTVILVMYMLDFMLNGRINPIFMLASGGISGLVLKDKKAKQFISTSSARQKRVGLTH